MPVRSLASKVVAAVAGALLASACSLLIETGDLASDRETSDGMTTDARSNVVLDGRVDGADTGDAKNVSDVGIRDSATAGIGTLGVRCQKSDGDGIQCAPDEGCCVVFGNSPNYCLQASNGSACQDPVANVGFILCDDDRDCTPGSICCATPGVSEAFESALCVPGSTCKPPSFHMCDPRVGCGVSACETGPSLGSIYGFCK